MYRALFSRMSIAAAIVAAVLLAAVYASSGGAMFSPGALHAADSTPVRRGEVQSHEELASQCGACHGAPWSARPMAARCLDCHEDVKEALGDTAALHGRIADARACVGCHTEHLGSTASLTRTTGFAESHDALGFALAAHARTADGAAFVCADCHGTSAKAFRFDDDRCESCHRDYQGAFVARHVAEWGKECRSCHDGTDRFSAGRFTHDSTALPLDGAHRQADCVSCHIDVRRLAHFADAPTTCIGCHRADDEHRGEFGTDCASCHSTTRWEGATFAHEVFPLDHGEDGIIACKTCHEDASNYKSYTCYNCHEHSRARVAAEHRGEVDTADLDDCVRCHEGGRDADEGGGEREREGRRRRR
jgi:hypothetical protein